MPTLNLGDGPARHAVADPAQQGIARAGIERAGGVHNAVEFGIGLAHHWTALARPVVPSGCAHPPKSPEKNQRITNKQSRVGWAVP